MSFTKRALFITLALSTAWIAIAWPTGAQAAVETVLLSSINTITRTTTKKFAELTQPGWFRGTQCIAASIGTRPGPPPVQTTTYDAVTDAPVKTSDGRLVICPIAIANSLPRTQADSLNFIVESIIWIVNSIVVIIGNVGIIFLGLASHFLGFFLSENRFVTHPFVAAGWPFLQGIANLGFVLGLLFIAGATALQLESYAWRKMLPKLLIAALLINFSLVIGAIIIDASRVLMAIEVRIMGGGNNIAQLGQGILKSSPLLKGVFDTAGGGSLVSPGNHSWQTTLRLLQAASLIWVLTVGLLAVAVGVFARWIALVLLLIFSPLAYLSFALPNAEGLGKKWWKEFLKWTFYGPILLFLVLIIAKVGDQLPTGSLWQVFTNTIIMGVLLYAAAKSSTSFAGTGGAAVMGFASKMGKSAGKKAAYGAYVGTGTQRVARNVRDFGSEVLKPARKALSIGEYSQYDDKGKLKAGKTSFGKDLGGFVGRAPTALRGTATGLGGAATGAAIGTALGGPLVGTAIGGLVGAIAGAFGGVKIPSPKLLNADQAREVADARGALVGGNVTPATLNSQALTGNKLKEGHVLSALANPAANGHDLNIDFILGGERASQVKGIVQNKDYLKDADGQRIQVIEDIIRQNTNITPSERGQALDLLFKTLDEIKKE